MTCPAFARRLFAAAAAAVTLTGAPASAGLLPNSVSVTPEAGQFRWTYNVVLPTDMQLQAGNFFTIYDFNGYVAGGETAPSSDWTFTASKVGPTPDLLNPADDAGLWNLSWKYTGATIPSGQIGLGNFWAYSKYKDAAEDYFTAQTNRSSDTLIDRNITTTLVPTGVDVPPPVGVPEPATLVMAGLGLPLFGLARLARKKK